MYFWLLWHFLPPKECVEHIRQLGMKDCMLTPPSAIIKEAFEKSQKSKTTISSLEITELAKQTLLPEHDVSFWLQHLESIKERRAEGVKKAQAKRRCSRGIRTSKAKSKRAAKSKDRNDVYCWCQEGEYGEMIACDNVACPIEWFHFECLGLTAAPAGRWLCPDCEESNR